MAIFPGNTGIFVSSRLEDTCSLLGYTFVAFLSGTLFAVLGNIWGEPDLNPVWTREVPLGLDIILCTRTVIYEEEEA